MSLIYQTNEIQLIIRVKTPHKLNTLIMVVLENKFKKYIITSSVQACFLHTGCYSVIGKKVICGNIGIFSPIHFYPAFTPYIIVFRIIGMMTIFYCMVANTGRNKIYDMFLPGRNPLCLLR